VGGGCRITGGVIGKIRRQVAALGGGAAEGSRCVAQLVRRRIFADADGDVHRALAAGHSQCLSDRSGETVRFERRSVQPELARHGP